MKKKKINNNPQLISYKSLRRVVGILGISFPFIMLFGSIICDNCEEVQYSLSYYYHTNMRDVYIGIYCAVGIFLFTYKGYELIDDVAGTLACIFALIAAFSPMSIKSPLTSCVNCPIDNGIGDTIHFVAACLFFITLSIFSLFLFTKGAEPEKKTQKKQQRNILYVVCGSLMLLCIILMGVFSLWIKELAPDLIKYSPVFWLETIMLLAFGISWLTKGGVILYDLKDDKKN